MFLRLGFSLTGLLFALVGLFELCIVIRVVLSWIAPQTNAHTILINITEPVVGPVRAATDKLLGSLPIDISPAVTIALLELLGALLDHLF